MANKKICNTVNFTSCKETCYICGAQSINDLTRVSERYPDPTTVCKQFKFKIIIILNNIFFK